MRAWLLGAALLLVLTGVRAETDYAALLDEAIANVEWDFAERWAYTETTLREEQLWVARYDPRVEADNGWKLLSVDGRAPTAREKRGFLADKDDSGDVASDDNNRVINMVEADSLQLVEETRTDWVLSFTPRNDEISLLEGVEARLRIAKQGPHFESLELRMNGESKPGFGTTVTRMALHLDFGPAVEAGPIVPKDIRVHIAGRALWFFPFEETEAIRYSDFAFAGD